MLPYTYQIIVNIHNLNPIFLRVLLDGAVNQSKNICANMYETSKNNENNFFFSKQKPIRNVHKLYKDANAKIINI